ncbi:hypothetical protein [Acidisarcina polymorpha]|uniref:hypothetical protein n=1 Tax=Acidisarcina polymorpha TaxID=2211140 RepID=UPI000DEF40F1|nr:hypothetical protein [Acidisarcina polymorpha]
MRSILLNARTRLTARFVLLHLGLVVIVAMLFALWLHIPDSSVLAVIGTGLLGSLISVLTFGGEAVLLRRLAGSTQGNLLAGAIALLLAAALWLASWLWLNHIGESDFFMQAAGYANSRFPHSLRNLFTFANILRLLGWVALALKWLSAGILLAIAVPFAQSKRPVRSSLRVLLSISYWLVLAASAIVVTMITARLVEWTPGHGLRVEALSLVLRLVVVVIVDAVLVCYVLAVIATLVVRSEDGQATPEGSPERSQPRSVDMP